MEDFLMRLGAARRRRQTLSPARFTFYTFLSGPARLEAAAACFSRLEVRCCCRTVFVGSRERYVDA